MKYACSKTVSYFFVILCSILCYQSLVFSQDIAPKKEKLSSFTEKVFFAGEEYRLKVTVFQENSSDGFSMWSEWIINSPKKHKKLTCEPSSMVQVAQIKASQNGKYLAIVSVGEGHPLLDILDLTKLIDKQECETITTINPYPGTINLEKWQGDKLIVSSSSLLTHKIDEQYPIEFVTSEQERFLIDPQTQEINGLSVNAKEPAQYFINLLSDTENRFFAVAVLGQLHAQQAIPHLQKLLLQEIDAEKIEQIQIAIKQIQQ